MIFFQKRLQKKKFLSDNSNKNTTTISTISPKEAKQNMTISHTIDAIRLIHIGVLFCFILFSILFKIAIAFDPKLRISTQIMDNVSH